eukprot:g470.t1
MDRRKKIEEKRKRLAELRRRKAERKKKLEESSKNESAAPKKASPKRSAPAVAAAPEIDLDNLIEGLLKTAPSKSIPVAAVPQTDLSSEKSDSDMKAEGSGGSKEKAPTARSSHSLEQRLKSLAVVKSIAKISVIKRGPEVYDKGIQTENIRSESLSATTTLRTPEPTAISRSSVCTTAETVEECADSKTVGDDEASNESKSNAAKATRNLSAEEARVRMGAESFKVFLERTTGYVERALDWNDDFNFTVEYGRASDQESSKEAAASEAISKRCEFVDSRWSVGRTVTDMDWSSHYKELFLATYNGREGDGDSKVRTAAQLTDPDGVLLVWSLHRHSKPEFVFTSPSPLMAAKFHPFSPNLIVGGTFSGQVLLFDKRQKRHAVQRTPISEEGHSHPIRSLSVVGSSNAHELVSVSSDGKICKWDASQLRRPTGSLQLQYTKRAKLKEDVAVMSLSRVGGDNNTVYVGSENGLLFKSFTDERHDSKDGLVRYPPVRSKSTDATADSIHLNHGLGSVDGHFGPVTAMDFHKGVGGLSRSYDATHLLLSSSIDWTCKLWDLKKSPRPLCEFQCANDYVLDVQWSPSHPAVFAAADAMGSLQLWNLNAKLEAPIVRTSDKNASSRSARALNRVRWNGAGDKLLTGDSAGVLSLYDVHSDIASPRPEEAARFASELSRIAKLNGVA